MKVCRLLFLTLLLFAVHACPLRAQNVAWTTCQGSNIASFINTAILGTDSTQEILKHEETHRAQARALVDSLGFCPSPTSFERLLIEIGAYCASDSVRVAVKKTPPFEASAITLGRLLGAFYPTLTADTIFTTWRRECPLP